MPIDPSRLCACHGKPMLLRRDGYYRCYERIKQQRPVSDQKYNQTEKGQRRRTLAQARYRNSPSYKAKNESNMRRRIYIGEQYYGVAETVEQARVINAHIKRRLHELVERQSSGAEAEGGAEGAVSAQAIPGADRLRGRRAPAGNRAAEVGQVRVGAARRRGVRYSGGA